MDGRRWRSKVVMTSRHRFDAWCPYLDNEKLQKHQIGKKVVRATARVTSHTSSKVKRWNVVLNWTHADSTNFTAAMPWNFSSFLYSYRQLFCDTRNLRGVPNLLVNRSYWCNRLTAAVCVCVVYRPPDFQSRVAESRPRLPRTDVYSAFHPLRGRLSSSLCKWITGLTARCARRQDHRPQLQAQDLWNKEQQHQWRTQGACGSSPPQRLHDIPQLTMF